MLPVSSFYLRFDYTTPRQVSSRMKKNVFKITVGNLETRKLKYLIELLEMVLVVSVGKHLCGFKSWIT